MKKITLLSLIILTFSCSEKRKSTSNVLKDENLNYIEYKPSGDEIIISRAEYFNNF